MVYDPVEQELVGEEEFLDRDEAEVAYSRLEAEHRSANGDRQVVLFGAPSREALEHTHPHYFRRAEQTGDTLDFMPV